MTKAGYVDMAVTACHDEHCLLTLRWRLVADVGEGQRLHAILRLVLLIRYDGLAFVSFNRRLSRRHQRLQMTLLNITLRTCLAGYCSPRRDAHYADTTLVIVTEGHSRDVNNTMPHAAMPSLFIGNR